MVVALVLAVSVPSAFAGSKKQKAQSGDQDVLDALALIGPIVAALAGPDAPAEDAPRLLSEALRSGTADPRSAAAIVRWVLTEKEEKVAAGVANALRDVHPPASGPEAERWNATARAIIGSFEGLLADAQAHRRRDGEDVLREVVSVAGPAVIAALSEAEPAAREQVAQAVRTVAPAAAKDVVGPLVQALHNADPSVRLGAATVLGAMGRDARAALPDLSALANDPDPGVREAAAQALERLRAE
jgi:HEAT repeat protein